MTDPAPETTDTRATWLESRKKVVTGTDLAALFGVGYKDASAMTVWLDKTGRSGATADNAALRFGRRFERPVLEEYADRESVALIYADSHQLVTTPEYPIIGATLDATRADNGYPVDAKNLGFRSAEFGEDGSDIMPLKYMLQLTAQMMVTKTEAAVLAVLFNRYEFCRYQMRLDPIVVERILERATRFMDDHVKTDTPPPVDGSESWTKWLGSHLRQRTKTILKAGPDEHEFALALHTTLEQIKTYEAEAEMLKNHLKLAIGEAGGIEALDWRITWSQSKDRTKIDWEGVARNLAQRIEGEGPGVGVQALKDQVDAHTTTSPGIRSFRFTYKEEPLA